ncbi:MAG: sugar ABC transporter permease [Anaerolineaceae bacterium]|nr:sugar ABC transporter permease [Anaerolineaceae bacterium]
MYYSSEKRASGLEKFWLFIRMILAVVAIVAVFYFGIKYLQNYEGNQIVLTLIAIVWGVGSVALFYFLANWIVERFSRKWCSRIQPYIFVGPAVLILLWALLIPTVRTFILSLKDAMGQDWIGMDAFKSAMGTGNLENVYQTITGSIYLILIAVVIVLLVSLFVKLLSSKTEIKNEGMTKKTGWWLLIGGIIVLYIAIEPVIRALGDAMAGANVTQIPLLENYKYAFTDPAMLIVFRNNLMWLILGTSFCVIFGLIIAVLADRTGAAEKYYKIIIFLPMAISFVGAGVIWKFIYNYRGQGNETGLLNAIIVSLGGTPKAWLQVPFWNNIFLIIIMIWLQTGYCMVILSSAIKGISSELLEAARIDGANEFQIFFKIIIPVISGTIISVTTTVLIFSLKTFDVVNTMTGGNYGTNVIANEFYVQRFVQYNTGRASAIAIVLLVLVIPVMVMNLRQFNERKAF